MSYLIYRELLFPMGDFGNATALARNDYAKDQSLPARAWALDWQDTSNGTVHSRQEVAPAVLFSAPLHIAAGAVARLDGAVVITTLNFTQMLTASSHTGTVAADSLVVSESGRPASFQFDPVEDYDATVSAQAVCRCLWLFINGSIMTDSL